MAETSNKPKRIKNILDYLSADVPKPGGDEGQEPVPGADEGAAPKPIESAMPVGENDDRQKRKKRPALA